MKILVCDDLRDRCDQILAKIQEAGIPAPEVAVGEDLTKELNGLYKQIRSCVGDPKTFKGGDQLRFDTADVVILDNNLTHLVMDTRLTAEAIAGYVRAFTRATYVVSLNLNPDVDFDLRYLVGDFSTRSDLALNTEHLGNPALWTGNPVNAKDGFLPWYWPRLGIVADRRRKQIDFVEQHLDDPVIKVLGFDESAIGFLSLHARGALSPDAALDGEVNKGGTAFDKLTFRDVFVAKDRSLPIKTEREALSEAQKEGNDNIRHIIARVVAAEIDLWFRRDVVGPQEPLVDIPHLLMRFPFLLNDRVNDINAWNNAISANSAPYGLEQQLYDEHLEKTRFRDDIWVPTPCFWWPKLKADEKLNEYFFKAKQEEWADVVFCEDRSAFVERTAENKGSTPIEFPAEFEGAWTHRYISRIEGYHYAPRSRLAL